MTALPALEERGCKPLGDCASRTVATREPSRVSPSRPYGRVSTIAGRDNG
jgi:hypothetical protein